MNKQVLKNNQDQIFLQMGDVLSTLSSPTRLKLIHFLSQQPLSVDILAQKTNQSIANTSMHLRKMLKEKILEVRGEGQKRFYSLAPSLFPFWELIQNFCQSLDPTFSLDIESTHKEIAWNKPLPETLKLLKAKKLLLLDIRPEDESMISPLVSMKMDYLSIPSQKIYEELDKLPKNKSILVLCRGRLCAMSASTSIELRKLGFQAYRFKESWFSLEQAFLSQGDEE